MVAILFRGSPSLLHLTTCGAPSNALRMAKNYHQCTHMDLTLNAGEDVTLLLRDINQHMTERPRNRCCSRCKSCATT